MNRSLASKIMLAAGLCVALAVLPVLPARAQEIDSRTRSSLAAGRQRVDETFTLSSKRWSLGWTGRYQPGRAFSETLSTHVTPVKGTKVYFHLSDDDRTGWETKVNQTVADLTLDVGAGSGGLFHSGLRYGKRKGKGFGFSVGHVHKPSRSATTLEAWHAIESFGLAASVKHGSRGLSWSITKEAVGTGILRFETTSLDAGEGSGEGSAHAIVYGTGLRSDPADAGVAEEPLRVAPEDNDLFGPGAIDIDSPLLPDERPLAWMVRDFGGRLRSIETLGAERKLEAETVKYLGESVWVGGQYTMEDGTTDAVDAKFGAEGAGLQLAASVGYRPDASAFQGSLQLRWRPGH